MNDDTQRNPSRYGKMLAILFDLPWLELIGELWRFGRKIARGLANEGVYEVLDYECQLELQDRDGKIAHIEKTEKIRYLQDYITTYQDQAWGDGEILQNYRCSPGVPVDEYRLGHKTYKLISLREFRNRGDIDDFTILWNMRNGFLTKTGYWGTAVNQRMKKATVKVIFPKDRPPLRVAITETNLRRTRSLGSDAFGKAPDGRPMVIWEKLGPRLYENYVLAWEW